MLYIIRYEIIYLKGHNMNNKLKLIFLIFLITLSHSNMQARCGSGAALAGGLIGGAILGSAIASSRPSTEVVYVEQPPVRRLNLSELKRKQRELYNWEQDLNSREQELDERENALNNKQRALAKKERELQDRERRLMQKEREANKKDNKSEVILK